MKTINVSTQNKAEFITKSVKLIEQLILGSLTKKPIINIALSGGSTPMPIYRELCSSKVEWDKINFFLVDERCVPNTSNQSNYNNISKVLFNHIPSENFPIISNVDDFCKSANAYEEAILKNVKQTNNIPQFDLTILGMGLDGHTASLFPGTRALYNSSNLVALNSVPQQNCERITMTYPLILNSNKIVLLIYGDEKKRILKESISKNLPISRIIPYIDYVIS